MTDEMLAKGGWWKSKHKKNILTFYGRDDYRNFLVDDLALG